MNNHRKANTLLLSALIGAAVLVTYGCATTEVGEKTDYAKRIEIPRELESRGVCSESQLFSFFAHKNPEYDKNKIARIAALYIDEARSEGINSDIAFSQMCLETGYLRFGGLVTESMNNFCGLGAIDANNRGCAFPNEQIGVRAHIQHLKAYAASTPLNNPCVDPRYKYVSPKGKSPTVSGLAGTWAADKKYGEKINGIISELYEYNGYRF